MTIHITLFLFLFCSLLSAGEYRYDLMATTGLQERVFDKTGAETTIVLSKKSSPEAVFLLNQIIEAGITGTEKQMDWNGAPYDQAIIIYGKLEDKVLQTPSAPNMATSEKYQEFVLEKVTLVFPVVRHQAGKQFDTSYLETHFSFNTIFPNGLKYKAKKIDLSKFEVKKKLK